MLRYKRSGSQLHLVKEHVKEHGREGGWVHSSTRNDNPGRMSSGELGYSVNGVSTKGHMRKRATIGAPSYTGRSLLDRPRRGQREVKGTPLCQVA